MLVLDGAVRTPDNVIQLAKALGNHFVIRGTHLAIVRRLDSPRIVQIQLTLLSWMGAKLAKYQNAGNDKGVTKALPFFRVLGAMVSQLQTGDGLQMFVLSSFHLCIQLLIYKCAP